VVEVHEQVTGLLGNPRSREVGGNAGDVDLAGGDLQEEQDVDPFEEHGIDGEEVAGQDGAGLGGEAASWWVRVDVVPDRAQLSAPKGVTVLDNPGSADSERCTGSAAGDWDVQTGPANTLTAGRDICVATDSGRAVMVIVVRAPDGVTPDLVFDYVVWQRPAP
jgi:hypothetical protein